MEVDGAVASQQEAASASEGAPATAPSSNPAKTVEANAEAAAPPPKDSAAAGTAPTPTHDAEAAEVATDAGAGSDSKSDAGADPKAADASEPKATEVSGPSPSASPAPDAAAETTAPAAAPASAPAAPAAPAAASGRRGSGAVSEELPLSLQRKQRQRRPPAGWDADTEVVLPSKRPKTEPADASAGTAGATAAGSSSPTANGGAGTAGTAAAAASPSPLSAGGVPFGTLFFRAQGRGDNNLLIAFDGSITRPVLFREGAAAGAEPVLLTEAEVAEEGSMDDLKCVGFARQDSLGGGPTVMKQATLAEVTHHFRAVLDPSAPNYCRSTGPNVYICITCDKSKGFMSYEIDASGNVCPKVVYELDGRLQSTSPAQFEAQVAQSSAKKWRHSFKAAGGFLKVGPRQGGVMPPATVLDVLNCMKDLLGVAPSISLPTDKPLTQQQRRAQQAAAAAAANAAAGGGAGGGASRGSTPTVSAPAQTTRQQQQEQRREREREREKEREKEREAAAAAASAAAAGDGTAATGGAAQAGANGATAAPGAAAASGGNAAAGAAGGSAGNAQENNRGAAVSLIHALNLASADGKPQANGNAAGGRTGSITIRLPSRAAQAAAAVAANRGGAAAGGGGSRGAAGAAAAGGAGGGVAAAANGVTDSQLQSAAALASTLVNHLALPLAPDVSALGLTGPGLTAAEAQAIQLVCTTVKGPELALAVKGIMDALAARPMPSTALATPAAAALALMSLPPGALAMPQQQQQQHHHHPQMLSYAGMPYAMHYPAAMPSSAMLTHAVPVQTAPQGAAVSGPSAAANGQPAPAGGASAAVPAPVQAAATQAPSKEANPGSGPSASGSGGAAAGAGAASEAAAPAAAAGQTKEPAAAGPGKAPEGKASDDVVMVD